MGNHALQAFDLGVGEFERIAAGIVTVGLELSFGFNIDDVFLQIIELGIRFAVLRHGQVIPDSLGYNVQRCRRKLRASLSSVTPDRSVIHQTVPLVDVLAGHDIRAFKK